MRTSIMVSALLIAALDAAPAHAGDRMQRARAIYETTCSTCHALEHTSSKRDLGLGRVNLVGGGRRLRDAALKAWLNAPADKREAPHCDIVKLDPVQRELVLALLTEIKDAEPPKAPKVPPQSHGPPLELNPPAVPQGQGDRR